MTLTDAQHQMKSVSAFIVDSTDTTSKYVASNGYCIGCELPGHMMHQHDALLSLYESLETFKVIKKFGLHSSRILQAATLNVIESLYRLHLKKRSTRM
jgi:hypothetical protein